MPTIGLHNVHSFYVDDIRLIVKTDQPKIFACKEIFDAFGSVSSLYYDWNKTKSIYLLDGSLPQFLAEIDWDWETQDNASRYLGVFMGNQISIEATKEFLLQKLEKRIEKATQNTSLIARVTIANHLILANLWCSLCIWVGTDANIAMLEARIIKFIWTQNQSK